MAKARTVASQAKPRADNRDFPALVRRVARGVMRLERDVVCCDVTLQQFETMRALQNGAVLHTSELATRLAIELSTATRNLQVLEREGYIQRVAIDGDARRVGNRLTTKGKKCVASLCCDERLVFDAVLERVPPEQRATLVGALHTLATALEGPAEEPCCASSRAKSR